MNSETAARHKETENAIVWSDGAMDGATTLTENAASQRQQTHYEAIHDAYTTHYFDEASLDYRRDFIIDILFGGHDLNACRVGELACGSGDNSLLLRERFPEIRLEGFDISERACADYVSKVGTAAHNVDLTRARDNAPEFDALFVIGGLHHCVADMRTTLENTAMLLKPGGRLFMLEPNKDFALQALRNVWYRRDDYFDDATEEALSHDDIAGVAAEWFRVERVTYLGGPAYFLILNSLILRVPQAVKRSVKSPLFWTERLYNRLPGALPFPAFAATWVRKALT